MAMRNVIILAMLNLGASAENTTQKDTTPPNVTKVLANAPAPAPATTPLACRTVSESDTGDLKFCYTNALWAKTTGITDNKTANVNTTKYYKNYPKVTADSPIASFQCILWNKNHNGKDHDGEEGHHCHKPCDIDATTCAPVTVTTPTGSSSQGGPPVVGGKTATSGGWPIYAWVLVGIGILLMIGAAVYYFMPGSKGAKKKRALKKVAAPAPTEAAPVTTSVMMPAPVYTTAVPMPSYTYATAAPVYHEAPAVTYAAPASISYAAAPVTYAAPASMSYAAPQAYQPAMTYAPASMSYAAAPAVTYAAPMAASYPIAAEPVTAYPLAAIDANQDGVITHQEFGAAFR